MKIADHIKHSLDAADRGELDQALLSACIAVDGTAKKMFPNESKVGERFRRFINVLMVVGFQTGCFNGSSLSIFNRDSAG